MVIIPDKAIYLATPRSASRTTTKVLTDLGCTYVHPHHNSRAKVIAAKKKYSLPTITLLRDPLHMLLSWWWPNKKQHSFATHISCFGGMWNQGRIYPYYDITDEYFLFTHGVNAFLEHLGLPTDVEMPHEGNNYTDPACVTEEHRQECYRRFPADAEIWRSQQ
jgi:hypothetical protein